MSALPPPQGPNSLPLVLGVWGEYGGRSKEVDLCILAESTENVKGSVSSTASQCHVLDLNIELRIVVSNIQNRRDIAGEEGDWGLVKVGREDAIIINPFLACLRWSCAQVTLLGQTLPGHPLGMARESHMGTKIAVVLQRSQGA